MALETTEAGCAADPAVAVLCKEKRLVARYPGGALRFQGEIPLPDGRSYLDRTTLIPVAVDTVRQLIEISETGGAEWRPVLDATYVRKSKRPG